MLFTRILLLAVILMPFTSGAQTEAATDSATNKPRQPKLYNEVIVAGTKTQDGFFKVHQTVNRYYFEIPDSLLDRELIVVNRILQGPAGGGFVSGGGYFGFAGDVIGKHLISFSKGPANKIFLKSITVFTKSEDSSANGLYASVLQNNLPGIVAAFDIKALNDSKNAAVIDITDYLNKDNDVFAFQSFVKASLLLTTFQVDKSYLESIQSFKQNIEIRSTRTYVRREGVYSTYEINSSIVLLPKKLMTPRIADARVGYFTTNFLDLDMDPQGGKVTPLVNRWRMEPRSEDIEKYLLGELVEPQHPIVYYIDPATPKKWVPFLIAGVNAWQKAFEKAGFKNAIYALEAPVNDPEWSLVDARHNAIIYKPSEKENASGPHVFDPRSGEILETHINWYHNVMQLLRDWYFIQASTIDPRARAMQFEDALMGQLIQYVCTHEVGHTLGLMHNFGSSSTVPVDSLRSKHWLEKNGHVPSIMDYARFNYVAQPSDSIPVALLIPRIGVYDEWAIEWAYRWRPANNNPAKESEWLNHWVIAKLKDKRLWFGNENFTADPRMQSEDLGDDAIKASRYGILNLQRILPNLVEWTKQANQDYSSLRRMYNVLVNQFKLYLGHVTDIIGGSMRTIKTVEQEGNVISYPEREKQKAALQFLNEQVFKTPEWIMDKKIYFLTEAGGVYNLLYLQKTILEKVFSHAVFSNLLWFETNMPGQAYTPAEFMASVQGMVWEELKAKKPITLYRRNLQKIYTDQLIFLTGEYEGNNFSDFKFQSSNTMTDIISLVKWNMKRLISEIDKSLPSYKNPVIIAHLVDVRGRLSKALKREK